MYVCSVAEIRTLVFLPLPQNYAPFLIFFKRVTLVILNFFPLLFSCPFFLYSLSFIFPNFLLPFPVIDKEKIVLRHMSGGGE